MIKKNRFTLLVIRFKLDLVHYKSWNNEIDTRERARSSSRIASKKKKQRRQNFFLDLEVREECWLYAMKAILRITQCDQRPIIKSHSKAIIKSSMYLEWFLRTTLKRVRLKSKKKLKCYFFRPQFIATFIQLPDTFENDMIETVNCMRQSLPFLENRMDNRRRLDHFTCQLDFLKSVIFNAVSINPSLHFLFEK